MLQIVFPSPEELARKFSRQLNKELTLGQMEQVRFRNAREEDPSVCHSHDFVDANQVMLDAMADFGLVWAWDIEAEQQALTELTVRAWNMAKSSEFRL